MVENLVLTGEPTRPLCFVWQHGSIHHRYPQPSMSMSPVHTINHGYRASNPVVITCTQCPSIYPVIFHIPTFRNFIPLKFTFQWYQIPVTSHSHPSDITADPQLPQGMTTSHASAAQWHHHRRFHLRRAARIPSTCRPRCSNCPRGHTSPPQNDETGGESLWSIVNKMVNDGLYGLN